jgi:2-oxoglutarate ferredoxin oxidoreductase subunit delta
MAKATVDKEKCKGCLLCVAVCPKGCLVELKEFNAKGVLPVGVQGGKQCTGCRMCAVICPDCCIEIVKE